MTKDLSKRARRGAAVMCHRIKLTIETSLPTWIQSWHDPQQIEADQHCHQQWKWLTYIIQCKCGGGGNNVHVNMVPHQRLDQIFHRPIRWTHECCGQWDGYIRVSLVVISRLFSKRKTMCRQWSNGKTLMTSVWGCLRTMERISVRLPQLDASPSALSTPKQHGKY